MTEILTPTGTEEIITPKDENNGASTVPPENPETEKPQDTPEVPPEPPAPTPTPEVDYKKKFGDSTRQNQIVVEQFKNLQKVLGDITKQEVPSDEEMRKSDPEWEYLSDREKAMAMKMVVLERRSNLILKTVHDISFESENVSKLQGFINNEPRLKGKEEEFYAFATKNSNKGASVDVLLNAFLFELRDGTPPTKEIPVPPPAQGNPPSLMRGSPRGGTPPTETRKTQYSDEEIAIMRTSDHKGYMKLVREGKI